MADPHGTMQSSAHFMPSIAQSQKVPQDDPPPSDAYYQKLRNPMQQNRYYIFIPTPDIHNHSAQLRPIK